MKKNVITFIVVVSGLLIANNVSRMDNIHFINEMTLMNIEALASGESTKDCPEDGGGCYNGAWYPMKKEAL